MKSFIPTQKASAFSESCFFKTKGTLMETSECQLTPSKEPKCNIGEHDERNQVTLVKAAKNREIHAFTTELSLQICSKPCG